VILHRIFDVKLNGGRLSVNASVLLSTCTHAWLLPTSSMTIHYYYYYYHHHFY